MHGIWLHNTISAPLSAPKALDVFGLPLVIAAHGHKEVDARAFHDAWVRAMLERDTLRVDLVETSARSGVETGGVLDSVVALMVAAGFDAGQAYALCQGGILAALEEHANRGATLRTSPIATETAPIATETAPVATETAPVATETEPVVAEPVVAEPVVETVKPVVAEPVVAEPVVAEPVVAEPVVETTEPVVAEPVVETTEPVVETTEPVVEPLPAESTAVETPAKKSRKGK